MTSHKDHSKGGFELGSKTKETPKSSNPKLWTQGVYTRVRVEGLQKRSGGSVASLSCQISMVPTQEKNTPSLRNQCSSLGFSNQDPLKGCFGPGP